MTAIAELNVEYLRERGFDVRRAEELGGGVSNVVLRVVTAEECLVFKQSLPKLKVPGEWLFDRKRIVNERRCMEWLSECMPGSAPQVRFHDDENFIFGMTCAPPDGVLWKGALLAGDTDTIAAERAGALLGKMHRTAACDPRIRQIFDHPEIFIQGRIDPYHRAVAKAHAYLAPLIEAEIDRMLAHKVTLVHGDYSPKNLFVYPDRILMLDFEVAHWGDPAFDVAFCLTHLLLKAIHSHARAHDYVRAAQEFWRGYGDPAVEANTIRELGCLMLARIDGKSKVEYLTTREERLAARAMARWLIVQPPASLEEVWKTKWDLLL